MRQARSRRLKGSVRGGFLLSLLLLLVLVGAPAASGETAVISATVKAGQVVVTWSLPSNDSRAAAVEPRHTATNIRWSTNPAAVASSGNSEGSVLACWLTGPSDGKHDCTGGRDLPDSATSFTITGLAPGTYYVQLQTYGLKYVAQYDGLYHFNAYSNVLPIVVRSSGGGTTDGTTGSGQTGTSKFLRAPGGPATVRWTGHVLVSKNGIAEAVEGGEFSLPPGVGLSTESRAVQLAIREGRLVLGKQSELLYKSPGSWEVYGDAWFSVPGATPQHRLVVAANGTTTIRVVSPAVFVVDSDANGDAHVQVYKGKIDVRNGFDSPGKHTTLSAGFELFVPLIGPSKKPPKKLTPSAKPFWK